LESLCRRGRVFIDDLVNFAARLVCEFLHGSATLSRTLRELSSAEYDKPCDVLSHPLKVSALSRDDFKLLIKIAPELGASSKIKPQKGALATAALAHE
jgi:hypothetical protein